jgi:hypothetical protein
VLVLGASPQACLSMNQQSGPKGCAGFITAAITTVGS